MASTPALIKVRCKVHCHGSNGVVFAEYINGQSHWIGEAAMLMSDQEGAWLMEQQSNKVCVVPYHGFYVSLLPIATISTNYVLHVSTHHLKHRIPWQCKLLVLVMISVSQLS